MNESYTDLELWEMMGNDERIAFEALYSRHSKSMFIYAVNVFKKREICEDIIQDVFVDLWSKRKTTQIINIKSYLFQSVKFQIFKQMRNQKVANEDLARLNIIDISMDISRKVEFNELEAFIRQQVNKLSPKCQQVFVMSRYDNKSNKEIALELGVSEQAVKNQISKALKFIRHELHPQGLILVFYVLDLIISF